MTIKNSKPKKKVSFIDELLDWFKTICKTFIMVILVFTFVARTARVEGESMEPTLIENDFLILWSLGYKPAQGDIIAANCYGLRNADGSQGKVIVKRIIATEGQEVYIDSAEGKVYVDGELFEVEGLENVITRSGSNQNPIIVEKGKYFVMGDNREHSTDSRSVGGWANVGLIDRDDILGKAVLRIFPLEKFGTLYS